MRNRNDRVLMIMNVVIIGLLVSIALGLVPGRVPIGEERRVSELAGLLLRVEQERDELRDEINRLRTEITDLGREQGLVTALESELERARMASGFIPVTGPGVQVLLADSERPTERGVDPERYLVHDEDIMRIINELRAAGAEALSINGQRVVALTEVRCVGPVISINNTRTAPPVIIRAIGEPATLKAAIKMRGGVADMLSLWGIRVEVSISDELLIPAYNGAMMFRYAVPAAT